MPPSVKVEDGPATSPVGALPGPRGAGIPAKAIAELISKCTRKLKAWLELGKRSPCKYRYRPTLPSVIGKYASQHGATAAAQDFLRKLEEQGNWLT